MKHLLIIMGDHMRADVLGKGYTPNIDSLSGQGVTFERAYCASPLCVPARGSFFTGLYPNNNGSLINPWENQDVKHGCVKEGIPNLYSILARTHDCYQVGKQHFYTKDRLDIDLCYQEKDYSAFMTLNRKKPAGGPQFRSPVPELISNKYTKLKMYSNPETACYTEDERFYIDSYFADGAVSVIKDYEEQKPLFLSCMFLAPHPPLHIPMPYYSMFRNQPLPKNTGVWCDKQSPLQMYNLTGVIGSHYSLEQWQHTWDVYLGLVKLFDDKIGDIIDQLKAKDIYDDTMIIFTSDHGEMAGAHGLWQKMCMYDEAARVPLIIKFPVDERIKNTRIDGLTSSVDILPTICSYLQLPTPKNLDGIDLMPHIIKGGIQRDSIFIQYDGNGALGAPQRCILNGNDKLIIDSFKDEHYIELYNLAQDPLEQNNQAFDRHVRVHELLAELRDHMKKTGDRTEFPINLQQTFLKNYWED